MPVQKPVSDERLKLETCANLGIDQEVTHGDNREEALARKGADADTATRKTANLRKVCGLRWGV